MHSYGKLILTFASAEAIAAAAQFILGFTREHLASRQIPTVKYED